MLAAILVLAPNESNAQSNSCLPSDSSTTFFQEQLVSLVTSTDTAFARARAELSLPTLNATDVQFVTDTVVCTAAAQQLAAITPGGDSSPAAWVFRMGPTRYVAFNFRQKIHGDVYLFVFDSSFTKLASFPL